MLTLLSVDKDSGSWRFLKRNKITVASKQLQGLNIKCIKCNIRRTTPCWKKIRKLCGENASRLLCSPDIELPEELGLKRFCSDELRSRLCLNMAIAVLRLLEKMSKKINVAVYDPQGRIADGVGAMLRYTDIVSVITGRTELYSAEAERVMSECGAVMSVSKRVKCLSGAHLVVAPVCMMTQLPLGKNSVILSSMPSAVPQKCPVYYNYYFSLGNEFDDFASEGIDVEYLASALYTLCNRYDLGSVVPQATKGAGSAHTLVSLAKYLANIARNA